MTTANFSWVGVAAYSPPSGGAANFAWRVTHTSTGWSATHIGAPKSQYNQAGTASGLGPARTGFPVGRYTQIGNPPSIRLTRFGSLNGSIWQPATGFSTTQLGGPAAVRGYGPKGWLATKVSQPQLLMTSVGWSSTAMGTPAGSLFYSAAPIGPTSVVSQAYYPFSQNTAAVGSTAGGLGLPVSIVTAPGSKARKVLAFGASSTALGAPTAQFLQMAQATGVLGTGFGAPATVRGGHASGRSTTSFGTAKLRVGAHPSPWSSAAFGTPVLRWKLQESGRSTTKFGTAKCVRPRTYKAYPLPARHAFGQPSFTNRLPHRAAGTTETHLGAPKGTSNYHALHTPPTVRWGTGLIRRT